MPRGSVNIYYKNVMSDVIGSEHGISAAQFEEIANTTAPLISEINHKRNDALLPYLDLPYNQQMLDRVLAMAAEIREDSEVFVVLGAGGSVQGSIALHNALCPYMYNYDESGRKSPQFFAFDSVDPVQLGIFFDWLGDKLEKTTFNVVSSSGETAETMSLFLLIREMLIKKLGEEGFKKRVITTTDPVKGFLRKITADLGLRSLIVTNGSSGQYSILSDSALLSAAVCGVAIEELLAGARAMDSRAGCGVFSKNPAAIIAAVNWHYCNRNKGTSVMMPFSNALMGLSDWYSQLWAEGLSKSKLMDEGDVFVGPTPVSVNGTKELHSRAQLYREGTNDKIFTFLQTKSYGSDLAIGEVNDSLKELNYLSNTSISKLVDAEKVALEHCLVESLRPCMTVLFDEINPYTVGQFIYLYEVAVDVAGALFNVNLHDKPAVKFAKDATFALMGREGFEDLAENIHPIAQIDNDYLV